MDATCKERINEEYKDRIDDLEKLWKLYTHNPEAYDDDLGRFSDYGLCFDYVEPGTFKNTKGYYRYQLSWGGPSDEFRMWVDNSGQVYKIEYWFLDWFDGASKAVTGENFNLLVEMWGEVIQSMEQEREEAL